MKQAASQAMEKAGSVAANVAHNVASPFKEAAAVAMEVMTPAQPVREEELQGRVYHEEHFTHGVMLSGVGEATFVKPSMVAMGTATSQTLGSRPARAPSMPLQGSAQANGRKASGTSLGADVGADVLGPLPGEGYSGRVTGIPFEVQRQNTSTLTGVPAMTATTMANHVNLGAPMPKWPAGHQSAAFEAVSMKKSSILSPAEIFAECAHHGEEKARFPWHKTLILSIVAGFYVGFGYSTCLLIGGNLSEAPGVGIEADTNYGYFKLIYGAVGFPFGFTAIVVCGAELYTSMCAYQMSAWWEGKVTLLTVLRMLLITWWGNFVGCVIMAGLFYASELYNHGHDITLGQQAHDKVSHGWGATFVKGIFANWLVALATWMANAAQDLTGKAVGIWLPISAFAMMGFEHCVANMFLFPMAWFQGFYITAEQFIWRNLIPATLGNFIGGGFFVATVYAMVYGRTPRRISAWVDQKFGKQD